MSNPQPVVTQPLLPPNAPKEGDVIAGKYRVERLVGMGGMGVVVAARHLELDERVAIKMLLPHLPSTGEPAARFIREAKAAIRIKSEHVVRVLDVGRTETGSPYIVMEYLEGYDLAQLVERSGPLPAEEAVEYVMQACEAIAAAHALGIVHRDLKPANLFLTSSTDGMPCIKVLDFGISKLSESASGTTPGLTSTTTVMGTPCYMSPEQLRSTRDVDGRADIWSLGAILHALMTGTPPYDGESNADVSAKIIRDAPTPLRELCPDATPELEAAVLRCLEKDPAKRFPDVVSLADALSQVTPRSSSKAAATRVARIAAAVAPTILSVPPPAQLPPAAVGGATPGPTRTASAWGDTRSEEKRGRKIAGVVAAAGIAAGVLVFGVLRWQGTSAPTVAAPPPPASIATAVPATASAVVVVPPPSVTASATVEVVASSPPAVKVPVSRGGAVRPAPTADTKARTAPKPTSTANLFEGRE